MGLPGYEFPAKNLQCYLNLEIIISLLKFRIT